MIRGLGVIALAIVAVWVVAHLLYIGPVQEAAEAKKEKLRASFSG